VPGHAGITGNEEADEGAKRAFEESIPNNEKYPPEDLSGWIKTKRAGRKLDGTPDPNCPFYSAKVTLEHILWQCKKTEEERRKCNYDESTKVWEKGEEGAKMLVEYVKNIGLH
jgi:hypothetical protein